MKKIYLYLFFYYFLCGALTAQTDTTTIETLIAASKKATAENRDADALEYAQTAHTRAQSSKDKIASIDATLQYVSVLRSAGQSAKAEATALVLVKSATERKDYPTLVKALSLQAQSLHNLARKNERRWEDILDLYTQALEIYHKQLSESEKTTLIDVNAKVLERTAVVCTNLQLYTKGEDYAKEALALVNRIGDKGQIEIAQTALANIYVSIKHYKAAIPLYENNLALVQQLGRSSGRVLNNLGICYAEDGQEIIGIEYYKRAIVQYEKENLQALAIQTKHNMAQAYNHLGLADSALAYYQVIIPLLEESKDLATLSEGLGEMVKSYILLRQYDKALLCQKKYIALRDSVDIESKKYDQKEILIRFEKAKSAEIGLANSQRTLATLQVQRQALELTNQRLKTETDKKALDLLQQTKLLQEAEIQRSEEALASEKAAREAQTTKLQLSEKESQLQKIQAQEAEQRSNIFRALLIGLIILVGLIGALVTLSVRARQTQQQLEASELRRVTERQLQQSELKVLRSQMNPHFIFNVLNSINNFSLNNDADNTSAYLTKFSRLMRLVLENSRSERISLENDLNALSLYIQLESLRFKNKIKYELLVDENIDQKYVKVPPLLIQPYVENSIWHGLMHKDEGGTVTVQVTQPEDNLLHICIEDDGIGRKAAAELKSKSAPKHKSFGMEITSERIHLVNHLYNLGTKIDIEDRYDDAQNACGTRVTLTIPC